MAELELKPCPLPAMRALCCCERLGLAVDLDPEGAALNPGQTLVWVDVDAPHRGEVDQQATVDR
jgi:hypothetical protein